MRMMPFDFAPPTTRRAPLAAGFAVALLAAVIVATINPIGYVGSGADDEQYLAAARCWIASGHPCIPASHWWTRWPAFAPIALATSLLGESRFSVGVGPGFYWLGALGLVGWLGSLWFGWRAGAIALALLGTTPMIAASAFDPNIDLAELALQAAALVAATYAYRRDSRKLALIAGVVAALAFQARDTTMLFLVVCAGVWLLLDPKKRRVLLWAILGLIATMSAEMLVYACATGDPLLRYRLALGHTNILSFELPAGFHSSRGPLLNPDYMRSWKREAHVTLWWPIDPWLNLLASTRSATLLITAFLSLGLFRRHLPSAQRPRARLLVAGAACVALMLVYGLAIDPKPRMFMSLWAALALVTGALLAAGARSVVRPIAITLIVLPAILGVQVMRLYPASAGAERRAVLWIAKYGQDIELDQGAASYLTLLPQARALALRGSGRRYLIATSGAECEANIEVRPGSGPDGRVIDAISGTQKNQGYLCLFEYLPVRASVVAR